MKLHKSITITGRVQGVGFRISASQKATACHLSGYVTNNDDGSVFVEVEGKEKDMEQFVDWCRTGPTYAKVEKILVKTDALQGYTSFEVR